MPTLIFQSTALVPGGSCKCRDELGAVSQGVLPVHLRAPPQSVVHSPSQRPSACAAVRLCRQLFCSPSRGGLCRALSTRCSRAAAPRSARGLLAAPSQGLQCPEGASSASCVTPPKYSSHGKQMTARRGCLALPGCLLPAANAQQRVPNGSCLSSVGSLPVL